MTISNDAVTSNPLPFIGSSTENSITEGLLREVRTHTAVELPYEFISIQGDKALNALQGQISCDLKQLKAGQTSYGSANTPKGRAYALFRITPWKNGYLLCLDQGMSELFEQTISKYLVFFRCSLTRENDHKSYLIEANDTDKTITIATPVPTVKEVWRTDYALKSEPASTIWGQWQSLQGIPLLTPATNEHFILQHLNLQHLKLDGHAAVSFSKGCYTGQEIIARMKYLGKLKKKMYLIHAQGFDFAHLTPGTPLFSTGAKKVGEVVRWHTTSDLALGLATLDIAAVEQDHHVFAEKDNQQTSAKLCVLNLKYESK